MKLVVDRIEGNIVVCENEEKKIIEISLDMFAEVPKDGDIIDANELNKYEIKRNETERNKKSIQNRFSALFKN